ncbi:hypothetical protein [Deinococcus cellulosilyticus]|uniref:hypothetical protein n=1 Tax=Deinococcus cellulosilyticus TaxID=401558 RepID=UPI003622E6B2
MSRLVVEVHTEQYKTWKEQQLQHYARLNEPLSLRRYPSKADLEAGKFNLRDLAQKQKAKNGKKKNK